MTSEVKAITSDNVLYGEGNVTEALDELNENLNICLSGDADETKVLSGYQTYYKGKLVVGTIPSKSSATYTPGTSNQIISAGQYLSENQIIKGDSNLKAGNIACGVTIFGVKGTKGCVGDTTATTKTGLAATAKVGEYVQMTPTIATYAIPTGLTGYTSAQTIKPSELKLWRIIRINNDGTIEMVSEYVSSTAVYFNGQTGYLNFVGALNIIASLYANYNYTLTTKHMGYNGQTEFITDTSKFTNPAPWTTKTDEHGNQYETLGGGDTLYASDTNLVKNALGTLVANKVTATTTATSYWLAARQYGYNSSNIYFWHGRYVDSNPELGAFLISGIYTYQNYSFKSSDSSNAIRPIVTLKSGVSASSGSGTKAKPWVLS